MMYNSTANSSSIQSEGVPFSDILPVGWMALLLSTGIAFSICTTFYLYKKRRELNTPQCIM